MKFKKFYSTFIAITFAVGNFWTSSAFAETYMNPEDVKHDPPVKYEQDAGHRVLGEFAPEFAHFNDDILFGEVWSRDDLLSRHDRSLITIAAFMGMGLVNDSLKSHIQLAKIHGVTKDELVATVTQLAFYTGWPKAWAAFPLIMEVYAE